MKRFNNGFHSSRLSEALLEEKLITLSQLNKAKEERNNGMAGTPLQRILIEKGFVTEDNVIKVYSATFDIPVFNPEKDKVDTSVAKLISEKAAKRYKVLPIRREGNVLILAMTNPGDVLAIDSIGIMTRMHIRPILARKSDLKKCIEKYYSKDDDLYDILKSVKVQDIQITSSDESEEARHEG